MKKAKLTPELTEHTTAAIEAALVGASSCSDVVCAIDSITRELGSPRWIHVVDDRPHAIVLHRPAGDGASGPLGHLGVCVGRLLLR